MNDDKREQTGVNNGGTGSDSGTRLTRDVPVMFELVSYRGEIFGPYPTAQAAADAAREKWPHQHQDEERTGFGWDIQIAGLT